MNVNLRKMNFRIFEKFQQWEGENYNEHEEEGVDAKDNEEQSEENIQTSERDYDIVNIQNSHKDPD